MLSCYLCLHPNYGGSRTALRALGYIDEIEENWTNKKHFNFILSYGNFPNLIWSLAPPLEFCPHRDFMRNCSVFVIVHQFIHLLRIFEGQQPC